MYIMYIVLLYIFMSEFLVNREREKCNFAILWQTFQQMSKLSSARGGDGPKLASLAGVFEVIDALAKIMGK